MKRIKSSICYLLLLVVLQTFVLPTLLILPTSSVQAQTPARTHISDVLVDASGNPRRGTVTFILTQAASSPGGLVPKGAPVVAPLDSTGRFTVDLYPSTSLSPQSYYQMWYQGQSGRESLGVYAVPASATTLTLAGLRVTNPGTVAQFTFASSADVERVMNASLLNNPTFNNPTITGQVQGNLSVGGNVTTTGTVTANNIIGNGAGITGLTGATGGISNTGSTTIRADSDNDTVGIIDIQSRNGVTGLRQNNDATVDLLKGLGTATRDSLFVERST